MYKIATTKMMMMTRRIATTTPITTPTMTGVESVDGAGVVVELGGSVNRDKHVNSIIIKTQVSQNTNKHSIYENMYQ